MNESEIEKLAAEIFARVTADRIREGTSNQTSSQSDAVTALHAAQAFMQGCQARRSG